MIILTHVACGTNENNIPVNADIQLPPAEVEVKEGDFIYRLYSEKDVYEMVILPSSLSLLM